MDPIMNEISILFPPDELIIRHVDLDWTVNFDKSTISGTATLQFKLLKADLQEIVRHYLCKCRNGILIVMILYFQISFWM